MNAFCGGGNSSLGLSVFQQIHGQSEALFQQHDGLKLVLLGKLQEATIFFNLI